MLTRLNKLCSIFGWNGGTIHQAQEEASTCLEEELDVLGMSDSEFERVCDELSRIYRSWLNYRRETLAETENYGD